MKPQKTHKYTINYTDQDVEQLLINWFTKMIVERDHVEIITQAKSLAREYMQQHTDDSS